MSNNIDLDKVHDSGRDLLSSVGVVFTYYLIESIITGYIHSPLVDTTFMCFSVLMGLYVAMRVFHWRTFLDAIYDKETPKQRWLNIGIITFSILTWAMSVLSPLSHQYAFRDSIIYYASDIMWLSMGITSLFTYLCFDVKDVKALVIDD